MKNKLFAIALGGMLALGAQAALYAQEQAPAADGPQQGQAEPGHRRMMDPDKQLEHLTKTLNLSADQQAQIKPLLVDRQQKMQALWQDQTLSRQDRRAKAHAIQQDTRTKLEATLNDQQKQQFEAQQAKMQERREQRMGGQNQAPTGTPQPE
jgi:periplasmic protein CpxP/Spy